MSSLDKMSIMGVRSFAPDNNQIVTFFSPLTLILGPNGTGKTTIIEALRYITTGDMPPNSSRGAAFVHDPKIAHEVEVRAQIKLKFRDAKGKDVTTTRSMVAVQKQKKLDFRSLDGTILRKNDEGKDVSISSKCAELDREMVACLGVSKAILNNVIFCHQEDSNWPLSEGKALKVKFDEIFAATRYIKALDNLHKLRLENDNEAKLFANELKFLAQYKEKANELKADLEKTETRLAISQDRVKRIAEKMKPIDDNLNELHKTESIINEVQTDVARKESELKVEMKSSQELDSKIVNKFAGSDEQLAREMDNFKRQLETKKEEKQELEYAIEKLKKETPQLVSKRSEVLLNLGKLRTESDQHQKRISDRDELVKNVCRKLNITVSKERQQMSTSEIERVERELEEKVALLSKDHQSVKDNYAEKEKELHKKQNTLRDAKTKIQHTETMRTKQINDARNLIQTINKELSRVEASAPRLQILEEELKRKEKELKEVSDEMNVKSVQIELDGFQKDVSRFESELRQLDGEMMRLHKQADVQAELDLARKEKVNKEDAIRRLKSKHEDAIIHLLGSFPTENIQKNMAKFTQELSREINKLKTHRDGLQVEIATNESNRKMIMNELQRKEAELRSSEELIFETCGSHNLDNGLSQLQTSIKNLHDEKGALTGTSYLYGKFIEKLHKKEPCCPVCHRSFNDQQDVDDLVGDLKMKLNFLPEELESKQKTLQEQQEKYNKLLEMKPIKSRVESLSSKEIPDLKARVKKLADDIEKTKNRKAEVEEMLMLKEADESAAAPMQSDLVLLEQNMLELKKVEKRIEQSLSRMIGGDSGRTMAQVSKEKLEMQAELDTLRCLQKNKQQQLNNHLERVQGLQAETNRLGSEQLQISRDMQKVNELEGRRTELTNEVSAHRKEIEDIRKQMGPLEEEIGELNEKLEQLMIRRDNDLDESQQKINEIRAKQKELSVIQKEIIKYIDKKRPQMLEECQKDLDRIDKQLQSLESKKQETTDQWQLLCKEIDNQQTQVRDLQDSYQLRTKQKHIQSVKQDIAELKSRLGGYNIDTMRTEKKSLEKQAESLRAERNKAEGGQRELDENIRKLRKELSSSTYGNADKNHIEKLIQLKTTKLASSDLTKYSSALDGAIMQYHSLKMKEINKIVRDLWNKTYQGNDIDFIEIRSDVDEISNVSSASGRRKQYKYRVVMIKGDVEQDMRGRCSAGQKVLASLIIRLSLAETFCINCGILALDEPTTNLDRDNIESLADALSNIVKSRSQQRNFQLIVITHDEDFLERLGRSDFVDYYYRVGKNEKGNSVVKRCHVQTLP